MSAHVPVITLHAFVDGELPPAEAARLAAQLADDPVLAQRVAHLYRLKAALAGFSDDIVPPPLPTRSPAWFSSAPRMLGLGGLAAAVMLLFSPTPMSRPAEGTAIPSALLQHDLWAEQMMGDAQIALPQEFTWMQPAVQSSGLQLVHLLQSGDVTHLGLKGPNRCRLSLVVTDSVGVGVSAPFQMRLSDEMQHARWTTGGRDYELIARDMADVRFASFATALHRESVDRTADKALYLAALEAARLPCRA